MRATLLVETVLRSQCLEILMKYTFGTSSEAAARLEAIARFFNPLTARLIREHVVATPGVAIDLGCGPGFTTDMLSRAAGARETYGLDRSGEFLARAGAQYPHCRFLEHDVTVIPFPVSADVMYVRFVLSHLLDPVEVVNDWITQLAVGGILVIEEVEAIDTEIDVFKRYLAGSDALVASQGARLFVGGELAGGAYDANILLDHCATLPVPDSQAAEWFLPNTQTVWRETPCVVDRLGAAGIEAISDELARLMHSGEQCSHITWHMRRLVLMRH
jgi:trans-aconitate 2-methyltransferase